MSDPLADPRARDLLSADVNDLAALAAVFRTAAGESLQIEVGLRAAQRDGVWTGKAATAFRRAIGRLPAELDKVRVGFHGVAEALLVYEAELSRIKPAFVQVIAELENVQSRLGPAQAAARAAAVALRTAARAPRATVASLTSAELAVGRADGAVADLQAEEGRLVRRAFALLEEFSSARAVCRQAISVASQSAPNRPLSGHGVTVIGLSPVVEGHRRGRRRGNLGAGHTTRASRVPSGPARAKLTAMLDKANALLGTPYVWGGGHGGWGNTAGLDCSGFVSAVLHAGGYLSSPQTTEGFAGQPGIASGPGRYVTIYDRTNCGDNEHVIIDLNGQFYEEGGGGASGGAPQVHRFTPSASYLRSFNTVLHPVGL